MRLPEAVSEASTRHQTTAKAQHEGVRYPGERYRTATQPLPITGVATAPPEKLSGRTRAARHTDKRTPPASVWGGDV